MSFAQSPNSRRKLPVLNPRCPRESAAVQHPSQSIRFMAVKIENKARQSNYLVDAPTHLFSVAKISKVIPPTQKPSNHDFLPHNDCCRGGTPGTDTLLKSFRLHRHSKSMTFFFFFCFLRLRFMSPSASVGISTPSLRRVRDGSFGGSRQRREG